MTQHDITVTIILKQQPKQQPLPLFSLILDFGKQNTCGNISKISVSLMRVIDRLDRNPPMTATSVTFRPSLGHASGP